MKKTVEFLCLALAIGSVLVVALIIMGNKGKELAKQRAKERQERELEPYREAQKQGNYIMPIKSQP